MSFQIANSGRVLYALALSVLLGIFLAWGFQPTSTLLVNQALHNFSCGQPIFCELLRKSGFLILALVFFSSLPNMNCPVFSFYSSRRLICLSILPLVISLGFGATKTLKIPSDSSSVFPWSEAFWAWAVIPLGEELLFRGWLTAVFNRIFPQVFVGIPPLMPLSLWASSLAFSLWHFQNLGSVSGAFLLFQLFYTFWVGIWLGFLRWHTGKIWPCVIAHFLLNFAADWKLWFVV